MNHSLFDPAAEREHPQPIFSTLLVTYASRRLWIGVSQQGCCFTAMSGP